MVKEDYVMIKCDMCGVEFQRHACHPYIIMCKKHRTRKARIKSGQRRIDGVNIQLYVFKQLLDAGRSGHSGRFHSTPDVSLQIVTYNQPNNLRFFRVGTKSFLNEAELIEFADIME